MIVKQHNEVVFDEVEIQKIRNMYVDSNMSLVKISEVFGVSKIPISKILKKLGLLRKGKSNGVKINLTEIEKEKIKYLYLSKYMSTKEIGDALNLKPSFIDKYLTTVDYRRNRNNAASIGLVKRFSGVNYDEYMKNLPEQEKYTRKVINLTNKQPISLLENHEKRGTSGTLNAYHLDHKFSILEGFKNGIAPEIIANLNNLVFIPWRDNVTKRTRCSITKEELINI